MFYKSMELREGYQICRERLKMDVDDAVALLAGRGQRRYSYAARHQQSTEVVVTAHRLICPFCEHRIPAYSRYLNPILQKFSPSDAKVPGRQVMEWGSRQIGFEEPECSLLHFNTVRYPREPFICPRCGGLSSPDDRVTGVELLSVRKKISLSVEITDVADLLRFPWLPKEGVPTDRPLYQTVTFNLANGHSYLTLGGRLGRYPLAVRDITDYPDALRWLWIHSLVKKNKRLHRLLRRLFQEVFCGALPFYDDELYLDAYVKMTRFIGYDRIFFGSIPYDYGEEKLDKSFRTAARRLHTRKGALAYFEGSSLPNTKSVRKCFFSRADLLFYLPEAERLWALFGDLNHFCRLMQSSYIYEVLALLHQKPLTYDFLVDYCRVMGQERLLRQIMGNWLFIRVYIGNYCIMSPRMKKRQQQLWRKGELSCADASYPSFSTPFTIPERMIRDCRIDGFSFRWLRSARDYHDAGAALDNCLGNYRAHQNPVVGVKQGDTMVAAIELRGRGILQARSASNRALDWVEGLPAAYEKWKLKFSLEDDIIMDDEDEYDDEE